MNMKGILLILFLLNYVNANERPPKVTGIYTHTLSLDENDPDKFNIYWKLNANAKEIEIEMHCYTNGWVGLGIASNDKIKYDVVVGWVKNKKAYLKDCHINNINNNNNETVINVDKKNNYNLIGGSEKGNLTILKFKRNILTCDSDYDREITYGINDLIFTWNDNDPTSNTVKDFKINQTNWFNFKTVLLTHKTRFLSETDLSIKNTISYEMKITNEVIADKDSFVYCELFKLPDFQLDVHLVRFETLKPDNIYSIMLYECNQNYVPRNPFSRECGLVDLSGEVSRNCDSKLMYVWGAGGSIIYDFPDIAGFRLQKSNKYVLLKIQSMGNNKTLFGSGLKIFYTETRRQNDIGLLALGSSMRLSLQIPPKTSDISFTSTCYSACSDKYFPDGINVVSSLASTYKTGKSVQISIVNETNNVVNYILNEPRYNYSYQYNADILPKTIKKGHSIITKCTFNTQNETNFKFRGYSISNDESCAAYLYYYPKQPGLHLCFSDMHRNDIYNFYRSLKNKKLIENLEVNDERFYIDMENVVDFFKNNNNIIANSTLSEEFKKIYNSNYNESFFCGDNNDFGNSIYIESIKRAEPKELNENKTCDAWSIIRNKKSFNLYLMILLSIVLILF